MNFNLNFPQATVLSTLIVTTGITGGIINLKDNQNSNPKNYATVNYDGGYAKIGIIYDENVYSAATVEFQGEIQSEGDFETVKSFLNNSISSNKTAETTNLLSGVKINATTGIEWKGTRKSFRLETDSVSLISSKTESLNIAQVINKFDEMLKDTKKNRKKTSKSSLSFGNDPNPVSNEWISFLQQILDLGKDIGKDYLPL